MRVLCYVLFHFSYLYMDYRELRVWQKSMQVVTQIYKLTSVWGFEKDRWLKDQIRRSAVSIPSNIAEWNNRWSDAEFRKFLFYAKWSWAEAHVQLEIALNLWYICEEEFISVWWELNYIVNMIGKLISTIST